jgi:hypothetical protein
MDRTTPYVMLVCAATVPLCVGLLGLRIAFQWLTGI